MPIKVIQAEEVEEGMNDSKSCREARGSYGVLLSVLLAGVRTRQQTEQQAEQHVPRPSAKSVRNVAGGWRARGSPTVPFYLLGSKVGPRPSNSDDGLYIHLYVALSAVRREVASGMSSRVRAPSWHG